MYCLLLNAHVYMLRERTDRMCVAIVRLVDNKYAREVAETRGMLSRHGQATD